MHRLKATTSAARTRDGRWVWRRGRSRGASNWRTTCNKRRVAGGARPWCCGALRAGVVDRIDTGGSIASGWMLRSGCLLVWWRTDRGTTVACATSTGAVVHAVSHTALWVRRNGATPAAARTDRRQPTTGWRDFCVGLVERSGPQWWCKRRRASLRAGRLLLVNGVNGPHPPGSEWHPGWHDTLTRLEMIECRARTSAAGGEGGGGGGTTGTP